MPEITFGKYVVEKKLGQGGMGTVYLAVDTVLKRQVALKVISSDDQEMLERFQMESQAIARLKHSNIIQVYDAGTVGKQHYFAMDYIEGTSLDSMIKPGVDYKQAARIIMQMALALDYAHSQNIVHRDIKPANILIDKSGRAYLTDFGIAKQITGLDKKLTLTGTTIGTPDYMSPEQAMGRKEQINGSSDIFSLGATLYHVIAGKTPFGGQETYEIFHKIINDEPARPSTLVRNIPHDLETICLKCLNKEQHRRYETAQLLADDLNRFLEGQPILARRLGTVTRIWMVAKKNKVASLGIASAGIIAVALLVTWLIYSYENIRVQQEKEHAQQQARQATDYARTLADALLTDLSSAHEEALERRQSGESMEMLAKIPKRIATSAVYKKAEADVANNAQVHYSFGRLYRIIGNNIEALKEQRTALKLDPNHGPALYETGILSYQLYRQMLVYLRDKWRKDERERRLNAPSNEAAAPWTEPDDTKLENTASRALKAESLRAFESALKNLEAYSLPYTATEGIIAFIRNELDKAVIKFRVVIDKDKLFDDAVIFLADIYKMRSELKDASNLLTSAIQSDRGNVTLYAKRAELLKSISYISTLNVSQDKSTTSINQADELNRIIQLQPDNYEALVQLGKFYTEIGSENMKSGLDPSNRFKDADQLFDKAVKIAPDSLPAYMERVVMNFYYGDYCWGVWYMKNQGLDPTPYYQKAISDIDKVLSLDPNNLDALEWKAMVSMNFGHYVKCQSKIAIEEYMYGVDAMTKAIKIDPNDYRFWFRRAGQWSAIGLHKFENKMDPSEEYKKSAEDFQQTLKLNNNSPTVFSGYASLFGCIGTWKMSRNEDTLANFQFALEYTEKALNLVPDSSTYYQHLGMARTNVAISLANRGEYTDAIKYVRDAVIAWRKALELNPSMKEDINGRLDNCNKMMENMYKAIEEEKKNQQQPPPLRK
ncbi:MAG: protein kinase [Candidatus Brocadiia bacterium]